MGENINANALRRSDPSYAQMIDKASQVALYKYNAAVHKWEKTEIEGCMFIYDREAEPRNSFLIMNRSSPDNHVEPITMNMDLCSQPPSFLFYKKGPELIQGLWFYKPDDCSRITALMMKLVEEQKTRSMGKREPRPPVDTSADKSIDTTTQEQSILSLLSKAQSAHAERQGGVLSPEKRPPPMVAPQKQKQDSNPNIQVIVKPTAMRPPPSASGGLLGIAPGSPSKHPPVVAAQFAGLPEQPEKMVDLTTFFATTRTQTIQIQSSNNSAAPTVGDSNVPPTNRHNSAEAGGGGGQAPMPEVLQRLFSLPAGVAELGISLGTDIVVSSSTSAISPSVRSAEDVEKELKATTPPQQISPRVPNTTTHNPHNEKPNHKAGTSNNTLLSPEHFMASVADKGGAQLINKRMSGGSLRSVHRTHSPTVSQRLLFSQQQHRKSGGGEGGGHVGTSSPHGSVENETKDIWMDAGEEFQNEERFTTPTPGLLTPGDLLDMSRTSIGSRLSGGLSGRQSLVTPHNTLLHTVPNLLTSIAQQHSGHNVSNGSISVGSGIYTKGHEAPLAPMTPQQLVQAFQYLLRTDSDMVLRLHEAYLESLREKMGPNL